MFDSCLLLGSNGHVVYSGPRRLALPYMAFLGFGIPPNENTADFLLDVTSGVFNVAADGHVCGCVVRVSVCMCREGASSTAVQSVCSLWVCKQNWYMTWFECDKSVCVHTCMYVCLPPSTYRCGAAAR